MPYDYQSKSRKFKGVSRQAVRSEIDKLTGHVSKQAAIIGGRFESGEINIAQFEIDMRDLLKSGHIIAASVGRGGRARMTQADFGRVGARLKSEYGYLGKLVRNIDIGKVAKVATANRAKNYASSIVMSYHETVRTEMTRDSVSPIRARLVTNSKEGCEECAADDALGWQAVEDVSEIGTRICKNFCKCDILFDDYVK